ncbi:MAG: DUF4388 domain-containing protein [Geobacteraceae bacterium]|nr:DUF4388 domain-containing protein [Geobacteraceae bacterium]
MSFTGDLAHLPIVDLIQLMNSTRKSGLLSVKGRKGESQLIFKDGYIVSASHLNNSIRIGQVLVQMGFVSDAQIEEGLKKQQLDGESRKPLAITLIELDVLSEQDAHKALQHLIEITIVEILTWKSGRFTLDHLKDVIDCDFRYYPARMDHEINVNTQSILMDALRIFDEKMRDGLIVDEPEDPEPAQVDDEMISADDLGLSEIDQLDTKPRPSFKTAQPFDPTETQRRKISAIATDLPESEKEKLVFFLAPFTKEKIAAPAADAVRLCLSLSDRLLCHAAQTCFTDLGFSVTEEEPPVESGDSRVWQVTDMPVSPASSKAVLSLCGDFKGMLDAYRAGASAVMPKPSGNDYADKLIMLLEVLPKYLKNQR